MAYIINLISSEDESLKQQILKNTYVTTIFFPLRIAQLNVAPVPASYSQINNENVYITCPAFISFLIMALKQSGHAIDAVLFTTASKQAFFPIDLDAGKQHIITTYQTILDKITTLSAINRQVQQCDAIRSSNSGDIRVSSNFLPSSAFFNPYNHFIPQSYSRIPREKTSHVAEVTAPKNTYSSFPQYTHHFPVDDNPPQPLSKENFFVTELSGDDLELGVQLKKNHLGGHRVALIPNTHVKEIALSLSLLHLGRGEICEFQLENNTITLFALLGKFIIYTFEQEGKIPHEIDADAQKPQGAACTIAAGVKFIVQGIGENNVILDSTYTNDKQLSGIKEEQIRRVSSILAADTQTAQLIDQSYPKQQQQQAPSFFTSRVAACGKKTYAEVATLSLKKRKSAESSPFPYECNSPVNDKPPQSLSSETYTIIPLPDGSLQLKIKVKPFPLEGGNLTELVSPFMHIHLFLISCGFFLFILRKNEICILHQLKMIAETWYSLLGKFIMHTCERNGILPHQIWADASTLQGKSYTVPPDVVFGAQGLEKYNVIVGCTFPHFDFKNWSKITREQIEQQYRSLLTNPQTAPQTAQLIDQYFPSQQPAPSIRPNV